MYGESRAKIITMIIRINVNKDVSDVRLDLL